MANLNINFGGQVLSRPGVYYQDIVTPPVNPALSTPPLIFIGYGYNGASGVAYNFTNAQDLTTFLRGGPAAAYVLPLTTPGPAVVGANNITFIPAGTNTPATITLDNSAASGVLVLTTATSGVPSNLTQVEVVSGSLYPSQTSTVSLYDGYAGVEAIGNNLGVPFQVAYTGSATGSLSFAVSGTNGAVTGLFLNSPNAGESVLVPLGSGTYATTSAVVEYINGTGYWTASLISDTAGELPSTYLSPSSGALAASGAAGYAFSGVVAYPYDAYYWINQFGQSIATAAVTGVPSATSPLANIPLTHFTGATSTPPTNGNYAACFNTALNQAGWVVFADSNSLAVQLLGSQHAETASTPLYGAYRRFFTGSSLGDSVATTLANAAAMNANSSCYVYPGLKVVNTTTSQVQTQPGLYAAALAAGIASANQVALPLTNKSINAAGLEVLLTPSQINALQIGGVIPVALGGANGTTPVIVSDQTTWQVDNNPLNALTQQIACRWWLAYTMINALQQYVGGIASPDTLTQIANSAKAALNASIFTPGSNGVLTGWDAASLDVKYDGATQTALVTATATTVGQFRFITEQVTIQLFSGSATVTAAGGV